MITVKMQFPYVITKTFPVVFGMSFKGWLSKTVITAYFSDVRLRKTEAPFAMEFLLFRLRVPAV